MSYVMALNPDISNLGDQQSMSEIRSGSNGYAWGDSEYFTGPNIDDTTDGRKTWDSNLSNGFDTNALEVSIGASTSGTSLSLADGTGAAVSSSDAAVNSISEVDLRAVVTSANSEAIWSSLTVRFYKGTALIQTVTIPTLDAKGTSSAPTEEALAIVTPSASDNTSVIITGSIRLTSTGTGAPGTDQMFCQALIR